MLFKISVDTDKRSLATASILYPHVRGTICVHVAVDSEDLSNTQATSALEIP